MTMYRTTVPLLAALIVLLGLGPLSLHAQPESETSVRFDVSEPSSGPLGQAKLNEIAQTIRRLEQHPMAEGADDARATLVQWLQASPDVEVSMCPGIAAPLVENESATLRRVMMQHLLSTAAYTIENPETDLVAAKLSGLKGALRVYEAAREKGAKGLDELLELREEGKLKKYVKQGVQSCQDTG